MPTLDERHVGSTVERESVGGQQLGEHVAIDLWGQTGLIEFPAFPDQLNRLNLRKPETSKPCRNARSITPPKWGRASNWGWCQFHRNFGNCGFCFSFKAATEKGSLQGKVPRWLSCSCQIPLPIAQLSKSSQTAAWRQSQKRSHTKNICQHLSHFCL